MALPKGKRPKHFKVHCSIQNHEKTAVMTTDNDLFATYVRLGILAVERFANKTGDSFLVSDRELTRLTGKGRLDVARTLLSRLAHVSPMSASREGDVWRITLPNFAKKQMFGSPDVPSGSPSYSDSYSDTHPKEEEIRAEAPAASVAVAAPRRVGRARSQPNPTRIDPRAEEAWPEIRQAFASHGCQLGERVGHDRAELIAKRLDEGATPDDLVAAVHGYVQLHDGLKADPKSGFNPRRWFQPKTVFKHEAFSDRVDAGRSRNVRRLDDERMARLKERWGV